MRLGCFFLIQNEAWYVFTDGITPPGSMGLVAQVSNISGQYLRLIHRIINPHMLVILTNSDWTRWFEHSISCAFSAMDLLNSVVLGMDSTPPMMSVVTKLVGWSLCSVSPHWFLHDLQIIFILLLFTHVWLDFCYSINHHGFSAMLAFSLFFTSHLGAKSKESSQWNWYSCHPVHIQRTNSLYESTFY